MPLLGYRPRMRDARHARRARTWFLAPLVLAMACAIAAAMPPPAVAASPTVDHSAWDQLLKTYVKPSADGLNRIDYAAFKTHMQWLETGRGVRVVEIALPARRADGSGES